MTEIVEEGKHGERDLNSMINEKAMEYVRANLSAAEAGNFEAQVTKYAKLASKTSDARLSELYYQRMLLPPEMAENAVRDFYSKETKNRVSNDSDISYADDEDGEATDYLNTMDYGNPNIGKGIFGSVMYGFDSDPATIFSRDEIFQRMFDEPSLESKDKIYLIVNMMFGTGPGMRYKANSDKSGLDIQSIMKNPPEEYKVVTSQIDKLVGAGVEDPTPSLILHGYKEKDDTGKSVVVVGPLMSTKRVTKSQQALKTAIQNISGGDSFGDVLDMFMPKSAYESRDRSSHVADIVSRYFNKSGKVTKSEFIKLIVSAIDANRKYNTVVSGSRLMKGKITKVARTLLTMASKGKKQDIEIIQGIIMAPALKMMLKKSSSPFTSLI